MLLGEQNKKKNNIVRVKGILNVEKIPHIFGKVKSDSSRYNVVLNAVYHIGTNCKTLNCNELHGNFTLQSSICALFIFSCTCSNGDILTFIYLAPQFETNQATCLVLFLA